MRLPVLVLALSAWHCAPAPVPPPPAPPAPPAPDTPHAPLVSSADVAPTEPPPPPSPAPSPARCAPLTLPALTPLSAPLDPARVAVDDPDHALAPFLDKVAALLRGAATRPLRVAVYGDSNITADWFTGGLRRTLQERLGDAGHGFIALGQPWPGYVHQDVRHKVMQPGWSIYAVSTRPVLDHRYGFAGITVQSSGPGARTWVATADASAPVGQRIDRLGVHFLRGPRLGAFEVRVDGQKLALVDSSAPELSAGFVEFPLDLGPHQVLFESRTRQPVRLFGATLERSGPGIVIDSLGVAASTTATLLRQDAAIHRASLAQRGYDLVIFTHGAFDVVPWGTEEKHAEAVAAMIARHREALPDAALLILSPADYRGPVDDSRASPARAAREKRELARAHHVAFWDLRAAMGGDRSISTFHTNHMADPDRIHFNARGGNFMGNRLALALWDDLARHLAAHPDAGCASRPADAAR